MIKWFICKITRYVIRVFIWLDRFDRRTFNTFTKEERLLFISKLQPGDVLICADFKAFLVKVIPGRYTHSMLYIGEGKVIEAVVPKVRCNNLIESISRYTEVLVSRPCLRNKEREALIQDAKIYLGASFDFDLTLNTREVYCSALIYKLFSKLGYTLTTTIFWWRPAFFPEDIANQIGAYNFTLFSSRNTRSSAKNKEKT